MLREHLQLREANRLTLGHARKRASKTHHLDSFRAQDSLD